jgi:hypothetical protein
MAMNFLGAFAGGGLAQPIQAIGNVLDKLFTSDDEKLSKQEAMARLAQQPVMAQVELNKIEAAHRSVFVAGWRPFIGWVCGIGLAWAFLGHPLFEWAVAIWLPARGIVAPVLITDHMVELVVAMLGLGGLRTVEKVVGRAK